MKKVLLSDSGPETSEAIYSFWRWNNKEDLNVAKIQDIIEFSVGLGINAFDVSSVYGNGKIQELVGEALSNLSVAREELVLFSKISNRYPQADGTFLYEPLTEKSIQKQVDTLLSSLKTEYIDVLLIEDFDPLMNVDLVASVLTSLQLRGKIKHVGVYNFNVQQHKLFASRLSEEVVTNHFELNLLHTKALEDGRLDFIKEQYSKPMAFGPLADGRILQGQDAKALAVRKVLSSLTEKYQSNIEQIAVAWIHKLGALPIIGSLSKERIQNAATAGDIQLSYQDWHQIYETIKSINS
jgi:predicted oxidoreductase